METITIIALDEYNDCHAERFTRESDPRKVGYNQPMSLWVLKCAHELADSLGLEEGEKIKYGTHPLEDVGAARLDRMQACWYGSTVL